MPLPLSVAIITLNEENFIGDCIKSTLDIADEIVVVDSFSSDKTAEISESLGAKVIRRAFDDFSEQKNFALNMCKNDWVLFLDADELLSEKARQEIKKINFSDTDFSGFKMKRKNFYLGAHVRVWDEWVLRLFRKSKGRWVGKYVHEKVHLDGKIGKLDGEIIHFPYHSVYEHLQKTLKFGLLSSNKKYEEGEKFSLNKLIFSPFWAFFKTLILKNGFKDGVRGLIISYSAMIDRIVRYSLLWERDVQEKKR
ncbi:SPBc2 prophage-derived glycosyltransferase SunS [bacterium HR19]|nr:SPBc2 prophage-derived glycosyltransferase SunS [bacterium HR19]